VPKVTFNNKDNAFYTTLKERVNTYFEQNKLDTKGNWRLYHKAIVLFALLVGIYFTLITGTVAGWGAIGLCVILGFTMASIGFNVMHDACHGSYSHNETVNTLLGYSLNILGGNSYLWKQKHNIIHHTYTNVDGVDDDIEKSPTIRHCFTQKWVPAHRFQHLYLPLIYGITSLAWVFIMDFQKYFTQKIATTPRWKMSSAENLLFWASKVFFVVVYMIIPIQLLGVGNWLAGFMAVHVSMGFTLAIVFQLAHVVENTHFVEAKEDLAIDQDWARHQVITTANFARKNVFVNWYVGGLNFQIEHHLFPKVSHVHYPAISNIVKSTCAEFDVPYNDFPSMSSAVWSHFKMMKLFGQHKTAPEGFNYLPAH
jgi:linoleoyl-CoA desaturase